MVKITFLGTRGYIKSKTRRHKRHTSTLIDYQGTRLMVDCGEDWLGKFEKYKPDAILITHAHPDHAGGLKLGAPCPVYGSQISYELIKEYPITRFHIVKHDKKFKIGPFTIEPFFELHSIRCPAVGYRIHVGGYTIYFAGDVISIPERRKALKDVDLFIGDGASIVRPIIRRKGDQLFGHTTIRAQIGWCAQEDVPRAIFTHCGSQIVEGDGRILGPWVKRLGQEKGVDARIAYDGLALVLKKGKR